ncbi:MAG: hypothetical protein KJN89_04455 [Gammaproteobacteria bacterium]|nr:hypothetical protein [Gammaproteobacteria bacterium]MBT8134135.1 hypothetical protein [Gammaproteobacteria bacterium]NNJ49604.1 hypothetical protein [Gammaproteobacteria bacterium]
MKQALFSIILFISLNAHSSWDSTVLIGTWESYKYGYAHKYQKIIINKDFIGSYFHIYGDSAGESVKFTKDDFHFFEGFAVLDADDNFKILLSAWGTELTGDSKRLLGQVFIYSVDDKEIKLINSEPVNFFSATEDNFIEFSQKIKDAQNENY